MATRRLSAACIAHTGRRGPLPLLSRNRLLIQVHTGLPAPRCISTTPIRYKQEANTKAKRDPAPVVVRGESKLFKDADSAVADLKSGSTILSAGFGLCGTAGEQISCESCRYMLIWNEEDTIIEAIKKRGANELGDLTMVSNNGGTANGGGLSPLVESGQITRLIMSFLGNNKTLERKYLTGEVAIELCPQGTIAERIRAAGAGIPAFFTPTGISTCI